MQTTTESQDLGVHPFWLFKAASGAKNGRWRVMRYLDGPGRSGQLLTTASGAVRTFKTYEAAAAAAEKRNSVGDLTPRT